MTGRDLRSPDDDDADVPRIARAQVHWRSCSVPALRLAVRPGRPPAGQHAVPRHQEGPQRHRAPADYFGGNGGDFGVGPAQRHGFGGRYDFRTGERAPLGLGVRTRQLWSGSSSIRSALAKVTGPVDQSVVFAELRSSST